MTERRRRLAKALAEDDKRNKTTGLSVGRRRLTKVPAKTTEDKRQQAKESAEDNRRQKVTGYSTAKDDDGKQKTTV